MSGEDFVDYLLGQGTHHLTQATSPLGGQLGKTLDPKPWSFLGGNLVSSKTLEDPWFCGDARHLFSNVLTSEEPQLPRSLHLTPLLLSYQ